MGDFDELFRYRVMKLGPQWVFIDGTHYQCHTPTMKDSAWFIATTPSDHRLFTVNPFTYEASAILPTNPPCGKILPSERHIPLWAIVQIVGEARLNDPSHGLEYYANYAVTVLTATRLVSADELSTALTAHLGITPITGQIAAYRHDGVGSIRLRKALVEGIVKLALEVITMYPEE